ncbi:hypothetical protein ACFWPA_13710 [Rhodococcus sp. NPDC058505]|uniref:hypothetical protein n=1 Tax=unclassified Rhodococcus (in: high G+C Gram-positive bacteria) TaxID=192944 RepID=UPI00365AD789
MRRTAGFIGATVAAVGLVIGTAGVATALATSIPGTTGHPYVAGVDVEPGSYYSRITDSMDCRFSLTQVDDEAPSYEGVGVTGEYRIVDMDAGDRLDSVGCTNWNRQGGPFGSAGSEDFGLLGVLGSEDFIFNLPLGS